MVEVNDAQSLLARRLRELRDIWPDVAVTQSHLARAFGGAKPLSVPLISSWESRANPKIPPASRLMSYAAFFATRRSMADSERPRLLSDEELTDAERVTKAELSAELSRLRAAALGGTWARPVPGRVSVAGPPPVMSPATEAVLREEAENIESLNSGLWRFLDGRPITIVCAQLPDEMLRRVPYSDPRDPDYVALTRFADLDAFVELHGHVRAANPGSTVNFRTTKDLNPDDYTTHLVLLGGVDWNEATHSLSSELGLPVVQIADWNAPEGPYFEARGTGAPQRFHPVLRGSGEGRVLHEDVALFARAINPFNRFRTVTICNGMYAGGTFGAVRALTDARFRDRNASYVRETFGQHQAFCILMKVRVERSAALTPDWTVPDNRLFEWMGED
jgi:hypothetical protein